MVAQDLSSHIALDIGSSSIKAAVLDVHHTEVVDFFSLPFPQPIAGLPAGHVEIDTRPIVESVLSLLSDALLRATTTCHVWISGQMGGLVLADESGRAHSNYVSWRDQRTLLDSQGNRSYMDRMRTQWPEQVMSSLGRELQPGSMSILLYWLSENDQLADGIMPLSIADYVISHLARQPGRMHPTQAIGLLDLHKGDWHYHAMERIGIGDLWWPELLKDAEEAARWNIEGHDIIVHGAFGDQQCALYGADLRPGELSINISTGSQVSTRTSSFQSGNYQTRAYFENSWLNTVTHLPAGRALAALVDLLTELARAEGVQLRRPWQSIAEALGRAETTDLKTQLTFHATPFGSQGSIENITTENLSVGQLFLAACRSMAENFAVASQRLSPRHPWDSLVLSGSLAQTLPKLVPMIVEALGASSPADMRHSSGEETLTGLLRLAQQVA